MTGAMGFEAVLPTLLGSVRILALFTAAPVFSHKTVPARVRAGLAAAVALAIAPNVPLEASVAQGLLGLGGVFFQEVVLGLALGFSVRLFFAAFDLLGEFVSIQGGLGAATVLDPTSGASSLALASTFRVFTVLVFLAVDGHHDVLRAVAHSYEILPVGGGLPDSEVFLGFARLGGGIFEIAVRFAAPITVAMLVSNFGVGILGRSIPQPNLMMIQLPAHVAITLALLLLASGALLTQMRDDLGDWTQRSLGVLVGAG